jgi:lysophospholipase L1-like esterase
MGKSKWIFWFGISSFLLISSLSAETNYFLADDFPRIGQAEADSIFAYERLPRTMADSLRPELWRLSTNSAGIAVTFQSNSQTIKVRWKVRYDTKMTHMPRTGIQGLDLYSVIPHKKQWNYVGTAVWWGNSANWRESTILRHGNGEMKSYALWLPLYDAVDSLLIGVDSSADLTSADIFPKEALPILIYGTSITQGGCASRPAMAYPAILSRMLHREVINFGFSGNGRLDPELADFLAQIPSLLLVIDAFPNVKDEDLENALIDFVHRFREKNQAPIVVIPNLIYGNADDNLETAAALQRKQVAYEKAQKRLKKERVPNLRFASPKEIAFPDEDVSVDGVHLSDRGMMLFAQKLRNLLD